MEQPRLRVKTCRASFVRNLDLRPKLHQLIEGAALSGPCVGRRDDSQASAHCRMGSKLREQQSETVPSNEGANQIDTICGRYLPFERVADSRLAASVHEQVAGRERYVRSDSRGNVASQCRRGVDNCQQALSWRPNNFGGSDSIAMCITEHR